MMNKTLQIIGITTSVLLMAGCQPADTGSEGGPLPSPTIAPPISTYTADVLAESPNSTESSNPRERLPATTSFGRSSRLVNLRN